MPLLQQVKIGKGINERTKLLNLQEIARALFTDPLIILKYFGYSMGTKVNLELDEKSQEISTIEINGVFDVDDVRKNLDFFINDFILCQKCKTPEMTLIIDQGKLIGKCNACGFISSIN